MEASALMVSDKKKKLMKVDPDVQRRAVGQNLLGEVEKQRLGNHHGGVAPINADRRRAGCFALVGVRAGPEALGVHLVDHALHADVVLDLSDDELDRVKSAAAQRDIGISSIGSPIGKVPVTKPFGPHLERFRRALYAADVMGAPYVRIFSFFIPEGEEPELLAGELRGFFGSLT
jgi:hypothetical protein